MITIIAQIIMPQSQPYEWGSPDFPGWFTVVCIMYAFHHLKKWHEEGKQDAIREEANEKLAKAHEKRGWNPPAQHSAPPVPPPFPPRAQKKKS